jgi:predicted RNA-binding protein (virulence factor B family)
MTDASSLDRLLGDWATLEVDRIAPHGALLVDPFAPAGETVLLPRGEVPPGLAAGERVRVFVALDSEDRPIATLRPPKLSLGEVAFLTVTDVVPFGVFCDWGVQKELLIPTHNQVTPLRRGERIAVGLVKDDSGRLSGTTRVAELLDSPTRRFAVGEWVHGEAWRKHPDHGVFVILERNAVGLLPADEPNRLERGEAAKFRIARVLPDGKVTLSLRPPGLAGRDVDAEAILAILRSEHPPRVTDDLGPDEVRALFGLSKKAFKRAIGGLLKRGDVVRGEDGTWTATHP